MRWLLLSLLILQTATCGQTGPLTLPEEQEQAAHRGRGGSAIAAGRPLPREPAAGIRGVAS